LAMATRGVQQHLTLPPAPESARTARRFVVEVLRSARADHFADTAALLTSELVTNGIVHAHTDLRLLVEATTTWVRVEVIDGNPQLPIRRTYDEGATTGRGLEMVELLATEFGVEPSEGDGKRVWFRLGAATGTPTESVPTESDASSLTTEIRLLSVPVALYVAWQEHADAMLRDAMLAAFDEADPTGTGDYPLASRALTALADGASEIFRLRDQDVAEADVTLSVAKDAVPWFPILRELLMHATELAEAGRLLVPPSLPEIVAVRTWICDEVARQSAGLAPTPWVAYEIEESAPLTVAAETLAAIRGATAAVVACDAANRIVAVSPAAGELLGWEPASLEGRRLVAVIPPRMRDRHVAGFTRYLLDGTPPILDRPVRFPALRRDGTEILVSLLVERRSDPATRALFVGTFEPVED
jgi:PAS domain S-box-containing protein